MKVQYQLQGTFHRIRLSGTDSVPVSLVDLITQTQAVATKNRTRVLQSLRQSFGLNFLPEKVVITLLQQAQDLVRRTELYQVPCLQLLHPVASNLTLEVANTYRYEFTSSEATFNLTPDNPQIPYWIGSDTQQPGIYTITLEQSSYLGLADDFSSSIWQQATESWQRLPEIKKIDIALQSLDPNNFRLITPHFQLWISIQDLSLDLRAAITFLRWGGDDISALSKSARLLVHQYQSTYSLPVREVPKTLSLDPTLSAGKGFIIARGNRRSHLEKIISEARQFLLISSYIIEDKALTELICQQSQQLPQGVWILTNLRNEVLDRIDVQVKDDIPLREEYQRSEQRKQACLRMLLNANIPIRIGAFHLKTYISEQYAYLGSCNLTPGSLDFNLEAGIISRNTPIHTQLITLFQQFWHQHSDAEVIPVSNCDGFKIRSINHDFQQEYQKYPNLLTATQYRRDLIEQLQTFQGQVKIYSRSFQPSPEIEQYLHRLDTQIFIDSQFSVNYPQLNVKRVNNLHAKITLLGQNVAYIGGINFNFNNRTTPLIDLMYKTINPQEINQIIQKLNLLYS